ncbi:nitronate monooxygenase [Lewinella marina]|uniref:Nitronate monooxygenase n=1 Tax=Neolewinella marina TaxID=438751 RepID=A0A2G0CEZ9_9BACT|nr:nitronate monooxygenase family protein [Neolewinella marina]NJB85779.1 nitronate monooxygenase [Neolewinella marina]PHK98549.1 nitronate monooxygenase [Neolewinella marina]
MKNRQEILAGLHLDIPVVVSPMFIVSQQQLVLESCKHGTLGTFPALNNRTTEGFEQWVVEIKEELAAEERRRGKPLPPFGVNLIVHKTNPRVQADLEVIVRQQVPVVITSLGAAKEVVDAVHSYGGLVFHDVTNTYHAQKAIDAGVDGLILVCAGAGGHAGTLNPIPFVTEIRGMFDGIILLAGGLSTGRDIATALQMGADLAYMGTRFISTREAVADQAYKDMIVEAGTRDIVYTASVSGIPANWMAASLEAAGITREMWDQKGKADFGAEHEAKAWKNLWSAGQGVATIQDTLPAGALISRLKEELNEAIAEQARLLNKFPASPPATE